MRLFWLWIWIISCAQLHYLDSCVWSLHAKQSNQPNQSISLTSVVNTVYFMGKLHQPLHQTADEFQLNQFMESTSEMPAAECVYCTMFLPDVVIPESPEAFVKLTEQTLRSSTGRQQQTPACHKCSGGQINSCTLEWYHTCSLFTSFDFDLCWFPHLGRTLWQTAALSNTGGNRVNSILISSTLGSASVSNSPEPKWNSA